MKYQTNAPAYPCMPIKDEFGRIIAAIPGFTKYEQVLLSIQKQLGNRLYFLFLL